MVWQDPVIALCVLVFTLTTLPMIRQHITPPLSTSVPMVIGAVILALVYITLALWFSVVIELAAAAGWLVLTLRGLQRRQTSAIL